MKLALLSKNKQTTNISDRDMNVSNVFRLMCWKVISAMHLISSGSSKISLHFCKDLVRETQGLLLLLCGSLCEHPSARSGPKLI